MKCQYFITRQCQSCDLLSQEYLASINYKEHVLSQLFPNHNIKTSVICKQGTEGVRNKAKLAVAFVNGQIEFGFYDNHLRFKELEKCPLHAPAINAVLIHLKKYLGEYDIIPYDLFTKKGELKYILLTYSESSNELLIRFILRSETSLAHFKKLAMKLATQHSFIKVVTANIQPIHQAVLEGEKEMVLTENDCITHQFDQYVLFQGPRSFFQTNTAMALQLYRQFQTELQALPIQSFLDLYCGVGAFSFYASKYCNKVAGVEISDAAIFYANKAAAANINTDINFTTMDVELFLQNQQPMEFDGILVNPPRRGLNDTIIKHLLRLAPAHLFYSSCNAETLHRDLMQLEAEYQIQSLQIFDMFPFTSHFETLAVLSRKT